jgi:hypothetical protein
LALPEPLHLAPAFDGPRADTEASRDFRVGALHNAELFEFGEVDFASGYAIRRSSYTILMAAADI